ncbi:transposase [Streptomyces sp. NBC_01267]|nr:transposase [Streptomyces sp. NBC_01267]
MIANGPYGPLNRPDHKIVDRTKIRDGAVANRPICVALAVTAEGRRDILGLIRQ